MLLLPSVWFSSCFKTVFKKHKSGWDIINTFISSVVFLTFFIIICQQFVILNTTWQHTTDEYHDALKEYKSICDLTKENNNKNLLSECKELTNKINTYPIIRAIYRVINGWHSCITMPCTQLLSNIANNFEYKIIIIIIAIFLSNWLYNIFTFTKQKTESFQDYFRVRDTNNYIEKSMMNPNNYNIITKKEC